MTYQPEPLAFAKGPRRIVRNGDRHTCFNCGANLLHGCEHQKKTPDLAATGSSAYSKYNTAQSNETWAQAQAVKAVEAFVKSEFMRAKRRRG